MRIHRALARAGIVSRRKAEQLVAEGRVTVNGAVARVGQSVDSARDEILVDGRLLGAPPAIVWLALNKPRGYVTSRGDPRGRRTVFDLAPDVPGLTYVGRLDYLTEGLLLLTNDGDGAHALTHPSREVLRTYEATVSGDALRAARALRGGITLEDGPVRAHDVRTKQLARGRWVLAVTLAEGRNREIRRACAAVGLEVERLVRTEFGPVKLGALPAGSTRELSRSELAGIRAVISGDGGSVPAEDTRSRSSRKPKTGN